MAEDEEYWYSEEEVDSSEEEEVEASFEDLPAEKWIDQLPSVFRAMNKPVDPHLSTAFRTVCQSWKRVKQSDDDQQAIRVLTGHLHNIIDLFLREPFQTTLCDHILLILSDAVSTDRKPVLARDIMMLQTLFSIAYLQRDASRAQRDLAKFIASEMISAIQVTCVEYSDKQIHIISSCMRMMASTENEEQDRKLLLHLDRWLSSLSQLACDSNSILDFDAILQCFAQLEVRSSTCYSNPSCRWEVVLLVGACTISMTDFKLMIVEEHLISGDVMHLDLNLWWLDDDPLSLKSSTRRALEKFDYECGNTAKTKKFLLRVSSFMKSHRFEGIRLTSSVGQDILNDMIWTSLNNSKQLAKSRELAKHFGWSSSLLELVDGLVYNRSGLATYKLVGEHGCLEFIDIQMSIEVTREDLRCSNNDDLFNKWLRTYPPLLDYFFEILLKDGRQARAASKRTVVLTLMCTLAQNISKSEDHGVARRLVLFMDINYGKASGPAAHAALRHMLASICKNGNMTRLMMESDQQLRNDEGIEALCRLRVHGLLSLSGTRGYAGMTRKCLELAFVRQFAFALEQFATVVFSRKLPFSWSGESMFTTAMQDSIPILLDGLNVQGGDRLFDRLFGQSLQGNPSWLTCLEDLLSPSRPSPGSFVTKLTKEWRGRLRAISSAGLQVSGVVMNLLARSEWYWVSFDHHNLGATNSFVAVELSANEFRAHHKTSALITEAAQTRQAPVALGVIASHKPLGQTVRAENRREEIVLQLIGDVSCTDLALRLNLDTKRLLCLEIKLIQEQDFSNIWTSLRNLVQPRPLEDIALFGTATKWLAEWRRFFQEHDVETSRLYDLKLLTWTSSIAKELGNAKAIELMLTAFSSVISLQSKEDRQFYLQLAVILTDDRPWIEFISFNAIHRFVDPPMSQMQFSAAVREHKSTRRKQIKAILRACIVKPQSQSPLISCLVRTGVYMTRVLHFL